MTFDGQVVHKLNNTELYAMRRKMGMMFQVSGLFSDLSVFDNIAYPMREHTDLPEDVIHDLVLMKLHAVGLRGAHALRTSELSGGMERRVALARAIALDPMLIMYDEPFAGLDPISLNTIANLIRRLNDALGLTSIVVTYDVSESLKVADYVYFIHDGVVVAEGNAAEMVDFDRPLRPPVRPRQAGRTGCLPVSKPSLRRRAGNPPDCILTKPARQRAAGRLKVSVRPKITREFKFEVQL